MQDIRHHMKGPRSLIQPLGQKKTIKESKQKQCSNSIGQKGQWTQICI